jgi:hypothetical protein
MGSACIFQTLPDMEDPNMYPLAWFAGNAYPNSKLPFSWQVGYYFFVWGQPGQLLPGVVFTGSEYVQANLSTENWITLTYDPDNKVYTFTDQGAATEQNMLFIHESESISWATDAAAVGIGMSGSAAFAGRAESGWTLVFAPEDFRYWVTFGGNFSQGEAIDVAELSNAAEIVFPPGVYSMTAVWNADGTWTVLPSSEALAAFSKVRGSRPNGLALSKVRYPAYQCFKTRNRDVYCSSFKVKNHDAGADWIAAALHHFGLQAGDILGTPYLSDDIPKSAIEYP